MLSPRLSALAASLLLASSLAEPVPASVKSFRDRIIANKKCANPLDVALFNSNLEESKPEFSYCGDALTSNRVIYLQGPNGALANMDIDCDGSGEDGSDNRCKLSDSRQSGTSFKDILAGYNAGVTDLNSMKHSFVVFGNTGSKHTQFDPRQYGVEPLSVMAIVCGEKLFYGVWGDENGDNMAAPVVGEASISLATACFGQSMSGANGHGENDVLYLAFPGSDAVPGAKGADWKADSFEKFHASIKSLGDTLIKRLEGGGGGEGTGKPSPTSTVTVQPSATSVPDQSKGGAKAGTEIVDGEEVLDPNDIKPIGTLGTSTVNHAVVDPETEPKKETDAKKKGTCSWGHCAGAPCKTENDCSDDLICNSGKCGKA